MHIYLYLNDYIATTLAPLFTTQQLNLNGHELQAYCFRKIGYK